MIFKSAIKKNNKKKNWLNNNFDFFFVMVYLAQLLVAKFESCGAMINRSWSENRIREIGLSDFKNRYLAQYRRTD